MSKRIVVTGLGAVTPVGNDVETFWNSLIEGKSGIGPITHFDTTGLAATIAGEVKDIDFSEYVDPKVAKRTDRSILLAIAAAKEAVEDSGLGSDESVNKERFGVMVSSGIGGMETLERETKRVDQRGPRRASPFMIPMMIADMPSGMVSIEHGFKGPNYGIVSACASATHGIGDALVMMKAGMMEACVVGGTEATITRVAVAGFAAMKALSTRNDDPTAASRPFDKDRDGFVMGEGSGILILETLEHAQKRGAKIYCELVGYGATGDAFHISSPAKNGEGAQRAIRMALDMAEITPDKIDYINAHGTSTPMNDSTETQAMKGVFGEDTKVSISSTKSMTGHLLGASGGIEAIAAIKALTENIIPPTINYTTPDEGLDLDYTPNVAKKKELNYVLSNSLGFGGHNGTIIFKKFSE
jgi:3-oxoacyl-[acyl-carrier-protein] synthase II